MEDRPGLKRRRARRLAPDAGWQKVLTALSQRVGALIDREGRSIAAYAATAGMSESGLQDILKARSDPNLSTLYSLGRCTGYRVSVLFELDPRAEPPAVTTLLTPAA